MFDVQNAWDYDSVTNTIWHPGNSGEGAHTTMYSQNDLIIHRIVVKQYKVLESLNLQTFLIFVLQWESGYATRMLLIVNGQTEKLSPINNDHTITGDHMKIIVSNS